MLSLSNRDYKTAVFVCGFVRFEPVSASVSTMIQ